MQNRFLNFLTKYWFCFLLSVILPVGTFLILLSLILSTANGFVDFQPLYLVLPLSALLYGVLSYAVLQKTRMPQLILFVATVFWSGFAIIISCDFDRWIIWLLMPLCTAVLSLFGAFVGYIIRKIISKGKHKTVSDPLQPSPGCASNKKSKKVISIIVALSSCAVIGTLFLLAPAIYDDVDFFTNRLRVLYYLDERYDYEIKLVRAEKGSDLWFGRNEDEFYFYDETNDINFQVACAVGGDSIYDYHPDAYNRKEVTDKVNNKFSTEEYRYFIRCEGTKFSYDASAYELMDCELFVIVDDKDDLSKPYEMLSFMKEEFPDLELRLVICTNYAEKQIIQYLEDDKSDSFHAIPKFHDKSLVLNDGLFSSFESFEELLQK